MNEIRTFPFQGRHSDRRVSRLPGWQLRAKRLNRLVRPATGVPELQDPDHPARRLEAATQENRTDQNFGAKTENLVSSDISAVTDSLVMTNQTWNFKCFLRLLD